MPPVVVSLINLKGGVGKTTTTIQLAECLVSEFGKRVLVIDLDPQTNATISLIDEERWEVLDGQGLTIFQLFQDKLDGTKRFDMRKAIQKGISNLGLPNLSLLPSSIRLINVQDRMSEIPVKLGYSITPMEVLKAAIHDVLGQYDYVLIDCPPNLGFITRNGIEISDYYLIPTIPDTLSTYGIPQIVKSIEQFSRERPLLKIRCLGLVVTKYVTVDVDVDEDFGSLGAAVTREVEGLGAGEVVGHVLVLQPTKPPTEPAQLEALEVVHDVVVAIAVGRIALLGLDAETVGRSPLSYPGANFLGFLRLFAGLGHYYTLYLCVFV